MCENVPPPVRTDFLHYFLVPIENFVSARQLYECDVVESEGQQAGHVNVVAPEVRHVVRCDVQGGRDVCRHDVCRAGTERRIVVGGVLVPSHESSVARAHHNAVLVHPADDDVLDGRLRWQVRHQRERVHDDIIVRLQHELGVAAIRRHPLQRRDRLVSQVTVGVDEAGLYDIVMGLVLGGQCCGQFASRFPCRHSENENQTHDSRRVVLWIAPGGTDDGPSCEVIRSRVYVDE